MNDLVTWTHAQIDEDERRTRYTDDLTAAKICEQLAIMRHVVDEYAARTDEQGLKSFAHEYKDRDGYREVVA